MTKTQHSAVNVEVIDENFYIPQLNRSRRIWVYKPAGYYQTHKRYPVLYMHDGQNLFDDATAFGEEWCVDETLNSLSAQCIVVGIDNSEYRMNECSFHHHEEHGSGEGREYIQFIVDTLKPAIDLNFRTLPQREYTHIAGSSMGGLISLYGAVHHAKTFSGAGVFSPSLWAVPQAKKELNTVLKSNRQYPQRYYFYGGAEEGCNMVTHINSIVALFSKYTHVEVDVDIDPHGEHSEYYWRNKFPDFYVWLSKSLLSLLLQIKL